jgi:hypothetical protein
VAYLEISGSGARATFEPPYTTRIGDILSVKVKKKKGEVITVTGRGGP